MPCKGSFPGKRVSLGDISAENGAWNIFGASVLKFHVIGNQRFRIYIYTWNKVREHPVFQICFSYEFKEPQSQQQNPKNYFTFMKFEIT